MPKPHTTAPSKTGPGAAAPTAADVALARAALLDITPEATVGEPAGSIIEADGVLTLYFDTTVPSYRGWKWTVSLLHGDDANISVLETELTPAEGALLAPDWVPWSERLAEYRAAQEELAAESVDGGDSDDDDDDDFEDDFDGADFDGVDIDSLDESEGSALPAVGDDKPEKSEGKPDDARPEPPGEPRGNQRAKKQQQSDEDE